MTSNFRTTNGYILARRTDSTVSILGNIVVLPHAFDTLFSKPKYPVSKTPYRMLILTVSLQVTKKHAIILRKGACILKRNALDVSGIRHVTCIRIPEEILIENT